MLRALVLTLGLHGFGSVPAQPVGGLPPESPRVPVYAGVYLGEYPKNSNRFRRAAR
jgi:hypothetical protein